MRITFVSFHLFIEWVCAFLSLSRSLCLSLSLSVSLYFPLSLSLSIVSPPHKLGTFDVVVVAFNDAITVCCASHSMWKKCRNKKTSAKELTNLLTQVEVARTHKPNTTKKGERKQYNQTIPSNHSHSTLIIWNCVCVVCIGWYPLHHHSNRNVIEFAFFIDIPQEYESRQKKKHFHNGLTRMLYTYPKRW